MNKGFNMIGLIKNKFLGRPQQGSCCPTNQLTVFHIMATSAFNGLSITKNEDLMNSELTMETSGLSGL